MSKAPMSEMVRAYLEACLWSTAAMIAEDDCDESWETKGYDVGDFHDDAVYAATKDCESFQAMAAESDLLDDVSESQAGHDFWLTRERHGTGFWDRGSTHGQELTTIAHGFGGAGDSMYLDADGKIHFNGDTVTAQWDRERS